MSIFNEFNKKEKPVFTGLKFGFGSGQSAAGPGLSVSGGQVDGITPGNGWTYHTFTSSGSLVISGAAAAKNAEFLIVAGGGGGGVANDDGSDGGGGAGAGNVNSYSNFTTADLGDGTFNIVVGAGGDPTPGPPSPGSTVQEPQVGSDSTVTKSGPNATLTAKGGGGGGHGPYGGPLGPHGTGGSGGGGGGGGGAGPTHYGPGITNTPQPLLPGATITQRGNQGGYGSNPPYFGGGGGGANGTGQPGTSAPKGRGGAAVQVPGYAGSDIDIPALNPLNGYYGGGGPGGSGGPGDNPAVDAPENGATPGSPASNGPRTGGSAQANTGGGGGGASGAPSPPNPASASGAGGSGIVVFRYQA